MLLSPLVLTEKGSSSTGNSTRKQAPSASTSFIPEPSQSQESLPESSQAQNSLSELSWSELTYTAPDATPISEKNPLHRNVVYEYTQRRKLESVAQIYHEWSKGLGKEPAVKDLEEMYKSRWRKAPSARKHYSRQKPLYDIFTLAPDPERAVLELDSIRIRQGYSIPSLCRKVGVALKEEHNGWEDIKKQL